MCFFFSAPVSSPLFFSGPAGVARSPRNPHRASRHAAVASISFVYLPNRAALLHRARGEKTRWGGAGVAGALTAREKNDGGDGGGDGAAQGANRRLGHLGTTRLLRALLPGEDHVGLEKRPLEGHAVLA